MALTETPPRRGVTALLAGSRGNYAVAALICIALILLSVNVIAGRFFNTRLDLTGEGLYTLSRGTRATLQKIDEPITVRFYFSTRLGDEIPAYGVYAQRVRELLDQYVSAARGKLRLEIYNPQPFSDIEDRAVGFGLQGVPLDQQGEQVYFGLAATNSTDDTQTIPFFQPERERFLEYDLTRLVHTLAFPKKTVVGLMTSLPLQGDPMAEMQGRPTQPMAVIDQLKQLEDIKTLSPNADSIPPDIDVLLLAHPQGLSDQTLYAIDQFVLKGGKALIFVDPYSELQASRPSQLNPPGSPTDSNLDKLFKSWGFSVLPNVVAGDRFSARKVSVPTGARGSQALDYIAWLNLRANNLNREDMITADLRQLTMASAGIIEKAEGGKTNVEPLISTSQASTKIPVEKLQAGVPDVAALLAQFKPDDKRYILAAHVTGPAATAFPDGPPKPPEKPGETPAATPPKPEPAPPAGTENKPGQTPEPLKQSAQPINVVVVADTDILDDRFWAQSQDFFGQRVVVPVANNGDFVSNAVEVLAGGDDLIGLRTRGTSARPFTVVEAIQRSADSRYSAEERTLQDKLKGTQEKLRQMTSRDQANAPATLSPEQSKAIEQFRGDLLQTRQQLRDVQLALRRDIRNVKVTLEFFDIALIPILVALTAIIVGGLRLKRRRLRSAAI